MTTVRAEVEGVQEALKSARISKDTRTTVERFLSRIKQRAGSLSTAARSIACPEVPMDSYAGRYYWQGSTDLETARTEREGIARAEAVNIDTLTDYDRERGSSPSSWAPRVELSITADGPATSHGNGKSSLLVDLDARAARRLALELLTAAEVAGR